MKKKFLSVIFVTALIFQLIVPAFASEQKTIECEFYPAISEGLNYTDSCEIPQYTGGILKTASIMPDSFDLRDSGAVTSIKRQGYSSACWSFAACASLESNAVIKGTATAQETDFSEAHLIWFAKNPISSDPNDNSCSDGENSSSPYEEGSNMPAVVTALARRSGMVAEKDYPFYPYELSKMGNYPESSRYDSGSGYVFDSLYQYSNINEVKSAIMNRGEVVALYYHDDGYYNETTGSYCYTDSRENESAKVNHAITVVGWDDTYSAENFAENHKPASDGAWLCRNSWGAEWGNDGFFWISYEDTTLAGFCSFIVTDETSCDYSYSYNGKAPAGSVAFTGSVTTANAFVAKRNETVKSVSFWVKQTGLEAEINIYTDVSATGSPFTSSPAYTYSFTTDEIGYLNFDLDVPVTVDKGERFTAAITFTAPDSTGKIYIPFESGSGYSANNGESFVVMSNTIYDTHKNISNVENVYINVRTSCIHSLTERECTESTCIENGSRVSVCEQCGKTFAQELPLSEHSFGEWVTVTIPTAVNEGLRERTCTVCGHKESETEPMLSSNGHKMIYIDDLIEMIFEKIILSLRMLSSIRRR